MGVGSGFGFGLGPGRVLDVFVESGLLENICLPAERLEHARVEELADLVSTEIEPRRLLRRRLGQAWG